MSLKTSFFNTSLFKSNIKRFWWVSVGYFVLFLTIGILPLVDYSGSGTPTDNYFLTLNAISMCSCAIVLPIIFSFLNSSSSVTALHAFPIKREAHYITGILTVYILFLIPSVLGYGYSILYCLVNYPTFTPDLLKLFTIGIMLNTLTIAGSTLGVMCTGNSIASIVFGILFTLFPFYTEAIIKAFLYMNVYGISEANLFFADNFSFTKITPFMVGYFIANIIILIICWFMYKKRKLEVHGDIISFKFLKPVFIGCVSVFVGFLGYYYLCGIYNVKNIFFMVPFGILGTVISHMLSKKAFTLKGILKPIVIYTLSVVALFFVIEFDLTGYERRIPDIDDVVSVNLAKEHMYGKNYYNYNGIQYEWEDQITKETFDFTDKEDIENVIALHSHLIENRRESIGESLPVIYTLKNGKQLKREYHIFYEYDKEFLAPVYETKQMKMMRWELLRETKSKTISVSVTDNRLKTDDKTFIMLSGSDERAKLLVEALKKDLLSASFDDVFSNSQSDLRVRIEVCPVLVNSETKEPLDENTAEYKYHNMQHSIIITPNYKNTMAILESWGLYDKIYKPEDFSSVELQTNINGNEILKSIADPSEIAEIYEFLSYTPHVNVWDDENWPKGFYDININFHTKDQKYAYQKYISRGIIVDLPDVINTFVSDLPDIPDEFVMTTKAEVTSFPTETTMTIID